MGVGVYCLTVCYRYSEDLAWGDPEKALPEDAPASWLPPVEALDNVSLPAEVLDNVSLLAEVLDLIHLPLVVPARERLVWSVLPQTNIRSNGIS